jgi:hypothetical protein
MLAKMRALLPYQKHAEDFFGITNPDRGFFINVYLREVGTPGEHLEPGNLWANRREAAVNGRAQVKGSSDKIAYRIRVKPKGPIPRRPPPEPFPSRGFYQPFYFHGPCMCQSRSMRSFR